MSRTKDARKPCDVEHARQRLVDARQFLEAAELLDAPDVVATNAVHAAIAASDAITCHALGERSSDQSHAAAVDLLRRVDSSSPPRSSVPSTARLRPPTRAPTSVEPTPPAACGGPSNSSERLNPGCRRDNDFAQRPRPDPRAEPSTPGWTWKPYVEPLAPVCEGQPPVPVVTVSPSLKKNAPCIPRSLWKRQ